MKVLLTIHKPLNRRHKQYNGKSHHTVIHTTRTDWKIRREQKQYRRQHNIYHAQQIRTPPKPLRQLERPISRQLPSALQHINRDGNAIANIEGDDASRDDGVERSAAAEEDAAKQHDEGGGQDERVEREAEAGVHAREDARKGEAAVASKGVGHAAGRGHDGGACEEEADEREDEEADGAGFGAGGDVEDLEDGAAGAVDDVL